jgi:hypothetical protein
MSILFTQKSQHGQPLKAQPESFLDPSPSSPQVQLAPSDSPITKASGKLPVRPQFPQFP